VRCLIYHSVPTRIIMCCLFTGRPAFSKTYFVRAQNRCLERCHASVTSLHGLQCYAVQTQASTLLTSELGATDVHTDRCEVEHDSRITNDTVLPPFFCRPGFESQQGKGFVCFATAFTEALGSAQAPIQWVAGTVPRS